MCVAALVILSGDTCRLFWLSSLCFTIVRFIRMALYSNRAGVRKLVWLFIKFMIPLITMSSRTLGIGVSKNTVIPQRGPNIRVTSVSKRKYLRLLSDNSCEWSTLVPGATVTVVSSTQRLSYCQALALGSIPRLISIDQFSSTLELERKLKLKDFQRKELRARIEWKRFLMFLYVTNTTTLFGVHCMDTPL